MKKESVGLEITEERIKNFAKEYHNNYSISFVDLYDKNNKPKGTKVVLKIPIT